MSAQTGLTAASIETLPDAITALRSAATTHGAPATVSGKEVLDTLDIAWCAAERWRIEQHMDGLEQRTG